MKGTSFLFLGPELGEKNDALDRLRAKLPLETEEIGFYAGETPLQEIVTVLKNGSLFSETRLIIIKNAHQIKKKEELEILASCIKELAAGTTLVLISEETRFNTILEKAVPGENKTIFWELFEHKKSEWVAAYFRRASCRIDESGIRTILEMVENNTDALSRECYRLILFLGKDKTITGEDVEQCLSHTREESVYTLFSAIARGNISLSLEILRSLSASKSGHQAICGSLGYSFRKLKGYLTINPALQNSDAELKKIGITTKKARSDYAEAAKRWPRSDGALALIGEYEYLLRSSGGAWEEILLDRLVFHLAQGIIAD